MDVGKNSGLASGAAFVATNKIESDRTHGGVKQRAIIDRVVSPPKLDEGFLDNVFGVSCRSCPLPGKKQQARTDFRKATLPILMVCDVVHDLFTVLFPRRRQPMNLSMRSKFFPLVALVAVAGAHAEDVDL